MAKWPRTNTHCYLDLRSGSVDCASAPEPSQFTGSWTPGDFGVFEITVWAFQTSTGNTGVDHTTVNLIAPSPPPLQPPKKKKG